MSTMILSRSRWTSTAPGGRSVNWSRIRGIVCHYPAMGRDVGVLSQAQETARIRGWRNYHVRSLGWSDLGYNYIIAQSGRVYTGRGDRVAAHAVGHNSTTIGVLFIVGDNEALTEKARESFRALRTTLRRRGAGSGVWGHTEMSGNSTRCPGPYIMGDIRSGVLKGGGIPSGGASAGSSRPSRPWESSPRVQAMSIGEVKRVQQALADRGYSLGRWGVDGKYGEATYNAVKAAQKALGVAVDGIAGPDTMNALTGAQKPAQKPSGPNLDVDGRFGRASVRALQEWLNAEHGAGLVVDGKAGHSTWTALQRALGTPVDGKVSNQSYRASELGNGITQGWDYDGRGAKGSTMVRALQKRVGVTPDGIWFEGTTRAVQRALNAGSL